MRRVGLILVVACLGWVAPAEAEPWRGASDLRLSPDARFLYAAGTEATLTYARADDGSLTLTDGRGPSGVALALASDGRHAYLAQADGKIFILTRNASTGDLAHDGTFDTKLTGLHGFVISPDGAHLYAVSPREDALVMLARNPPDGGLRVINYLFKGQAANDIAWLSHPWELAVSPDGRSVYLTVNAGIGTFRRDPVTGVLTPVGANSSNFTSLGVQVSSDGSRVYSGPSAFYGWSRNQATGELTELSEGWTVPCADAGYCNIGDTVSVSPDGGVIVGATASGPSAWTTRATASGVRYETTITEGAGGLRGVSGITGAAWTPDGTQLYTVASPNPQFPWSPPLLDSTIALWRRDPGRPGLTQIGAWVPDLPKRARRNGMSIEDGARFTNSRRVTVRVNAQQGYTSLRLAHDSNFDLAPSRRIAMDDRYEFALRNTGLGRDVRRVYAWLRPHEGPAGARHPLVLSDDIVLDTRDPLIRSAKLRRARVRGRASTAKRRRSRLLLRAKDNRSGIKRVQVTTKRKRPGRKLRFKRTLTIRGNPRKVWVRVFDGAGNASRWRRVKRR